MQYPVKPWLLLLACLVVVPCTAWGQASPPPGIPALLGRLEQALQTGDPNAYTALLSQSADRKRAAAFAAESFSARATRAIVRERDRSELAGTLPGDGYELLVEVLVENGPKAWLATWRLDVRRRGDSADQWGIVDQHSVTSLQGLYRLSLNSAKQYSARNLVVTAEDLRLTLESGSVFVCETDSGVTGLVLLGRGDMTFSPSPEVERGQVRLFSGSDTVTSPFEVAFVRFNPLEFDAHVDRAALTERPLDPREIKRAEDVFRQDLSRSFGLDLGELSSESWSLLPSYGDFLAEIRTRRFDTLTYSRSNAEVEDISLFDRKNRRNLALYSSKEHLAEYTKFFSEDDRAEFRINHYDVDVSFNPSRRYIEGRARLAVVTTATRGTSTLTLRVADSLTVRSVVSTEYGRLLFVRVRNHNAIIINLPGTFVSGVPVTLTVDYAGELVPQPIDREAVAPQSQFADDSEMPVEESFLYSTRSYWYPQSPTLNYATARLRITVPAPYSCVASGELMSVGPPAGRDASLRQFTFTATQPVRYLAFVATPLIDVDSTVLHLGGIIQAVRPPRLSGTFYDDVTLTTRSSPRVKGRARGLSKTGQDIIRFFTSIIGDCPYPSLMLAVVERQLPGGHSPAYLSVIAQPSLASRSRVGDDPASFPDFPEFFMAHELAHQWWGQAVGWSNYHEQWLSEGFAQYFAALYAERARGRGVFDGMLSRMGHWALEKSDQGPVYLGYRIGHIKGDGRVFRAIVYDKGAVVLHLLRQLVGDRAFFNGIRRFYQLWRFEKAGSNDLRKAMEAESGMQLGRFFDEWIYGQELPQLGLTWRVESNGKGSEALVRIEQQGRVFDTTATVTLEYADATRNEVVVPLRDQVAEIRVPLAGTLRRVDINRDRTLGIVREAPPR